MSAQIDNIVRLLVFGGLIIAGAYFIKALVNALSGFIGEMLRINTEKKNQEVENPVKILKIRYAKGEISKEEYEEMKKVLEKGEKS